MNIRKIAGIGCIAFGALNILNFWAPVPIPTVGASAFIAGAIFIGLGIFLRAPRSDSGRVEWGRFANLSRNDAGANGKAVSGAADPLLSVKALRLAAESRGVLTVSLVAMKLNVPLDTAQAALDECAIKGAAYINIDGETGIPRYCFPEFMPKE